MPPIIGTKLAKVLSYFGIKDVDLPFFLSQVLVPVFDVGPFTREPWTTGTAVDCSGALGGYVEVAPVPAGRYWTLKRFIRGASTGPTAVLLRRIDGTTRPLTIGGTAEEAGGLDIRMRPGESLGLMATGNVADNALWLYVHYEEETF